MDRIGQQNRPPNIRSVSRRAGVSPTTVSRVLNNSPIPTDQTRRRVLEAVKELGYQPDPVNRRASARSGRRPQTGIIGYLTNPDVYDRYHDEEGFASRAAAGLHDRLREAGRHVLWSALPPNQLMLPPAVVDGRVEGLLVEGDLPGPLLEALVARLPVVLISRIRPDLRVSAVTANYSQAIQSQLDYLWRLGHRRIAMFQPAVRSHSDLHAARTYEAYFQDKDLPLPCPQLFVPRPISTATHERTMADYTRQLLADESRPTALIASNTYARSLLFFLAQAGVEVPRQFSVAGVNDEQSGADANPPLTSFHFPMDQVGRIAADLLLQHIEQPNRAFQHVLVYGHQVERASCGPCREFTKTSSGVNP